MTQMADKDRPCTPVLPFTLPTPSSVFNFTNPLECRKAEEFQQPKYRKEGLELQVELVRLGKERQLEEQTNLKKAICRPRSVRGVGLKQEAPQQTVVECIIQAGILCYWEVLSGNSLHRTQSDMP